MTYEEKLAALGINRGQLAAGFGWTGIGRFRENRLLNRRASRRVDIRPVAEDLTALNPPYTATYQEGAKKHWASLTPEQRRRKP